MFHHAYVVCLSASCVSPQYRILHDLQLLVEDARGDHIEEVYSGAGLMTALKVAMTFSFCLPHTVTMNNFIIC